LGYREKEVARRRKIAVGVGAHRSELVEEMRRKVRRKLAAIKADQKAQQAYKLREENKDQEGIWQSELVRARECKLRKSRESKQGVEIERTYKLLSRGIASHFYKNLNKSQC
jgi:hypothetical protein